MYAPTIQQKPNETEIRKLADARIRQLLKSGPELSEEAVLAGFSEWVLPDRHLTIIRERVERWQDVARRRATRKLAS